MDEKYLQELYNDFAKRYGANNILPFADFTKRVSTDNAYAKQTYDDLSKTYGKENILGFDDFYKKTRYEQPPQQEPKPTKTLPEHYAEQEQYINMFPPVKQPIVRGDIQGMKGVPPLSENMQDKSIAQESASRKQSTKELRTEAVRNTVKRKYENLGIPINEKSKTYQSDLDLTAKALDKGDIVVTRSKTGEAVTTRGAGFGESLINTIIESVKSPIDAYKVNTIADPKDLADFFDQKLKDEPEVAESIPTGVGGKFAQVLGGAAKPIALLAIPYAGEGIMVGEAYFTATAHEKEQLYQKGLQQNLDLGMPLEKARVEAAQKAIKYAGVEAIPDAAVAYALARNVKSGLISTAKIPAVEAFKGAVAKTAVGAIKMGLTGTAAASAKLAVEQSIGFDVKGEDAITQMINGFTDYAAMDLMFKAAFHPLAVPKYLSAMAKEGIRSLPKEVVDAHTENIPEAKEGMANYEEARQKVSEVVPTEQIPHFAGLAEKQNGITKQIEELEKKKEQIHPSLHAPINEEIKDLQVQSKAIDNQMSEMAKSGQPLEHEIDQLTGERISDQQAGPEPKSFINKAKDFITGIVDKFRGKKSEVDPQTEAESPKVEDKPILTDEQKATDLSEAQAAGYDHPTQALNSIEKRTGVKYQSFQEIPKDVLEKVSRDRTAPEPVKEFTSKQGHTLKSENGSVIVVNKEGKEVSRGTRKKVIREAAESYDFTQGRVAGEPKADLANPDEYTRHVIENSTSPAEIAGVYVNEQPEQSGLSSKESLIAEYGIGKITEDSYRNFGDRNSQNHNKARAYFSKSGTTIDSLSKEISDHYDKEITPQDIVDFIDRFPNGADAATAQRESSHALAAKDRFFELTGLPLDKEVAEIALRQRDVKEAEKIPDEALEIIEREGITAENIENLKHLFDGFPYSESEYETVKSKLGAENKDSARPEKDGEGGEAAKTEKHYEEIAGSKPNNKTGRVPVDPIIGGTPKRVSEIIRDVSKSLSQKVSFSKPSRSRAIGTYAPGSTAIKIRYNGDLDTTAHELGHSIDDAFAVISDLKTTPNPTVESELKKFSKYGSKPQPGHPDPKMYKYGEGFAEWLRAYVVNPTQAIKEAPELYKIYEAKVSSKFKKAIEDFSTDVRTWAGASGRDITLANIEWKPEEAKGIIKKIFSKSANDDMFHITWADKLAANFVNPMRSFEKAWEYAKKLKGVGEVLPEDDPTIMARLLLSVDTKFGEFLTHGLRDSKDVPIKDAAGNAKTFKWLIEPLDNTDEVTIKNDMQDTISYMVAERTVELSKKFDRESVLTGIGGGIYKDVDVAKKTLGEFTSGDPTKLKRIQEAADRYRSFSDDILRYMVDKGRLSDDQYQAIKDNNAQYVALRRVIETEPDREIEVFKGSGGKLTSVAEPVKAIKGSTKTIANPYISLLDTMNKSIKEADRNDIMRAFRDILVSDRKMYDGIPEKIAEVAIKGAEGDNNTITIFVDGKAEKWLFQEDIYKALKGLDSDGYKIPKILTLHAKVLRATVTKFPVFALRNIIRDTPDRIIKSTDGSGFKDFFGNKEHWHDIARNGGLNAGYYVKSKDHYYGLMEQAMTEMTKKGTVVVDGDLLKRSWEGYESILQKSETANRVAEYRAALRTAKAKGMDDYNASLYASFKARDLMDFALMGHYMKVINKLVPFSNAAVQGLRSTYNSAIKNPLKFGARVVIYTVIPQVALWALNHKDDETAKEYEELPDYQRDMFFNFKIGPNRWVAIPKPYELGLIAAAVDRSLSKAFGYNDNAFNGLAGETIKTLSPIDQSALTNSFTPELELMFNKSLFTGKHIIPENEEPLNLTLRNTEYASRLGQSVQRVAGLDARKFDYWVKAHFSYVGDAAIKASNIGDDTKQGFDATTTGLIKRTPAYNSKSVQAFLDFAAEWDLGKSSQMKHFKGLAHDYFNAKTDEEKESVSDNMIDFAKSTLKEWKPLQEDDKLKSQVKASARAKD